MKTNDYIPYPDLICGHCKATIEKVIYALDPAVGIDMGARRVPIKSGVEAVCMESALAEVGYHPVPV